MGRSKRQQQRWRGSKRFNRGVQFTIEVYIPTDQKEHYRYEKARQQIVQEIRPCLQEFVLEVKQRRGIAKVYQNV